MPSNPYFQADPDGHKYDVTTWLEHLVCEYTGLNFFDIQGLILTDYLVLRRDAFIHHMNGSEKGQEYLDQAYLLEQTEPDRKRLREKYGRKEDQ